MSFDQICSNLITFSRHRPFKPYTGQYTAVSESSDCSIFFCCVPLRANIKKRHGHIAVLFLTNSRVRDVTWNMIGLSSPHRLNLLLLFNSKFIGLSTLKMQTLQVEEVLWLCQISATSCPLYARKFEIYRSKFALLTVEMFRLILPAFYSPGQPFTLGVQAKMNPRLPEETITVIKWRFLSSSGKQTQLPARGR